MVLKIKQFNQQDPKKTTCLLIHGFGIDSSIWLPFAKKLDKKFNIELLDLPGYGFNHDIISNAQTMAELAEEIKECITKPVILIGWSFGGMLGIKIAAKYKNQILGLITIASNVSFIKRETWPEATKLINLKNFIVQIQDNYEQTINKFLALTCLGNKSAITQIREIKKLNILKPNSKAIMQGLTILEKEDLGNDLANIKIPTLQIFGDKDMLVPVATVKHINYLYPHINTKIINNSGHAPFLSHTEEVLNTINQFYITHT